MSEFPPAVTAIVADYLERVGTLVPPAAAVERDDLVKELQSHVYEAYRQTPAGDDVARILSVLRRLGEPAEVVSEWLPRQIVRSGTTRLGPLHILGGIVVALFGVPLGLGGVAVLAGMLVSLAGVLVAFYAVAASTLLTGAILVALGLVRTYGPELWDKLVALGVVSVPSAVHQLPPAIEGLLFILSGTLVVGLSGGMFWLGARFARGLWFLFALAWDGARRLAEGARRTLRREGDHQAAGEPRPSSAPAVAPASRGSTAAS